MTAPAACLFDLDGLLLDTEPLHGLAWRQAAEHFGIRLDDRQVLQLRGRRRHDCAEQVLSWIAAGGGHCAGVDALLAVRQPIAERLLVFAPPIAGAEALVRHCHALGVPMALATSSSRAAVALKAAPHPWLELIGIRVHGDDPELVAGKPAPDVYLLAAERLGVAARDCWAFEDSLAGARAAVAAGCRVHVLLPAEVEIARSLQAQLPTGCQPVTSLEEVRIG